MNRNGLFSPHLAPPGSAVLVEPGEPRMRSRARLGKTPALSLYPSPLGLQRVVAAPKWLLRAWRKSKSYELTVRLDHLSQLFTTPSSDPFSEEPALVSGMDWILDELTPHALGWGARTKTTIVLPKGSLDPSLANKASAAVKRYCQFKVRQNQHALVALRWQGVKALQMGIVFLAGCLLLSAFLSGTALLPGFLGTLFSNGLEIAGWVSLWRPIEIFLYEWWPYWRENQLYTHMMNMQIVVVEEEKGAEQ